MKIAILDFGSYVLPYDFYLIKTLLKKDISVDFYCSNTKYNGQFLNALMSSENKLCKVYQQEISKTTTKGRVARLIGYLTHLKKLWGNRKYYDSIILQFPGIWIIDVFYFILLKNKFAITIHNPVPHNYTGLFYFPYYILAKISNKIIFPSEFTAGVFYSNYSRSFENKGLIIRHGLIGIEPNSNKVEYDKIKNISKIAFWGTIKPYKGIELLLDTSENLSTIKNISDIHIYGAWSDELKITMAKYKNNPKLKIVDKFLNENEVKDLYNKNYIFILPYINGSQSGVMYTLLMAGQYFISTDVGDSAILLRKFGLENLILKSRTPEDISECLNYFNSNIAYINQQMNALQDYCEWEKILNEKTIQKLQK